MGEKHAFLIIAHNEFDVLQRLLLSLDDDRIDFFIHIDKKVNVIPSFKTRKSSLFFVNNRIDTRWGNVSQIRTEFAIFKEALKHGGYCAYHLISGVHYPLKSTDEILAFYDKHSDCIILDGLCKDVLVQEDIKMHHYNLFTRDFACGPQWRQRFSQKLWRFSNSIQTVVHIKRNDTVDFFKASNWVTLTEEAVEYLLGKKEAILRRYKWTFCGDEYFIPTELINSPLKDSIRRSDHILFQQFGNANPRVICNSDFDDLVASGCLFARKFTASSMDVIDRVDKIRRKYEKNL